MIGQFGVGFYSVYMVADEVAVTSRSYRSDAQAVRWTSQGDNTYTLEDAEKTDRGTEIVVHLKEDADDYAQDWKIEQIVKKHSDLFRSRLRERSRRQSADGAVAAIAARSDGRAVR